MKKMNMKMSVLVAMFQSLVFQTGAKIGKFGSFDYFDDWKKILKRIENEILEND